MPQRKKVSQKVKKKRPKKATKYKEPKKTIAVKSDTYVSNSNTSAQKNKNCHLKMSKNNQKPIVRSKKKEIGKISLKLLKLVNIDEKTRISLGTCNDINCEVKEYSLENKSKKEPQICNTKVVKDQKGSGSEGENATRMANSSRNVKGSPSYEVPPKRTSPRKNKNSGNDTKFGSKNSMCKESQIGFTICHVVNENNVQDDTVKMNCSPNDEGCSQLGINSKRTTPRKRKNSTTENNSGGKKALLGSQSKKEEPKIGVKLCHVVRNQSQSEKNNVQDDTVNIKCSLNEESCSQLQTNTRRTSPRKRKNSKTDNNSRGKKLILDTHGNKEEVNGDEFCHLVKNQLQPENNVQDDTAKVNCSPNDDSCSRLGPNSKRTSPRKRKNSKKDNSGLKKFNIQGNEAELQNENSSCRVMKNQLQCRSEDQDVKINNSHNGKSCSLLETHSERTSSKERKNSKKSKRSGGKKPVNIPEMEEKLQAGDATYQLLTQSGKEEQDDTVKTSFLNGSQTTTPRESSNDVNSKEKKVILDIQALSQDLEDDSESDDDLPDCFESTPTKRWNEIAAGELVWAKAPRYPRWPAIVQSISQHKARVIFLMSDHQKCPSFPIKNAKTLKPYSCPERSNYIEEALKFEETNSEFLEVIQKADDYQEERVLRKKDLNRTPLQDQKLLRNTDIFQTPPQDEKASSTEDTLYFDGVPSPAEGPPIDTFSSGEGLLDDAVEVISEKKVTENADITKKKLEYEKKGQRIAKYIKKSKTKDHLIKIFTGTINTERHNLFHHANKMARAKLNNLGGYGPILADDLLDEIFLHIKGVLDEYCRSTGYSDAGPSYILNVSIPEAIIFAIQKTRRVGKTKAEDIFFKEHTEATKLEGGTIPRTILDKETMKRTMNRAYRKLMSNLS
ncbi:uncharacterized protein LOC117119801 [Anneissia japonica]|uniref:uncharacterized protein LOC117119801 n=1 Tax=Anneissia japonica TaxID=1529436 RepID=UPI001425B38E|nr:uncharacterized protein LOC117119801 [Anneissia japonica]